MEHRTIRELTTALSEAAIANGEKLCPEAIEWLAAQPDLKTVWRTVQLDWRVWTLRQGFIDGIPNCPWRKLSQRDIAHIVAAQPRLESFLDWDALGSSEMSIILRAQPQLVSKTVTNKMTSRDRQVVITRQPALRGSL